MLLVVSRLFVVVMTVALAGALVSPAFGQAAPATFATYELGAPPTAAPGTVCPNTSQNCTNGTAEPAIRADNAGKLYASSENGLGSGTEAWRSSDGGRHFTTLPSPNSVSVGPQRFAPGGGDTDLAVAPVENAAGVYNVYVASLNLANVDVSTSTDGGQTWKLNPTSATIPGDDREWIAADDASKVCISYHDVATNNIDVSCSQDAGTTFLQPSTAIDAQHAFVIDNNEIGNLAIDPQSHTIYQVFSGIATASEAVTSATGGTGFHAVWMGVSR